MKKWCTKGKITLSPSKRLFQQHRAVVLGYETIDGVLGVLSELNVLGLRGTLYYGVSRVGSLRITAI